MDGANVVATRPSTPPSQVTRSRSSSRRKSSWSYGSEDGPSIYRPQGEPFFTLFQTHFVCSCAQRHISQGEKVCLRITKCRTAADNVNLMKRLLWIESDEVFRFEDEEGNAIVPDYEGLKHRSRGKRVRIIVFIERGCGELLVHKSARRRKRDPFQTPFVIHEDKPVEGWCRGDGDGPCGCNLCMLMEEKNAFDTHYKKVVDGGYDSDADSDDADDGLAGSIVFRRAANELADTDMAEDVNDATTDNVRQPGRPSTAPAANDGARNDIVELHYGRVMPRPNSTGVPASWTAVHARKRAKLLPTDEEFRTAAKILRHMR